MADDLAAAILHDGRAVTFKRVRFPRAAVTRALQGLPSWKRTIIKKRITEAERWIGAVMGEHGPLTFAGDIRTLRENATRHPRLTPLVRILEDTAIRNELAIMRYDAARSLSWMRAPAPLLPPGKDTFDSADAEAINAHHDRMMRDPVARAAHNRWSHLRDLVVWTERAVTALDAGTDATYAVAQAFRCRFDLASDGNAALYHIGVEQPARWRRQGAQAQMAAVRKRNDLPARNARLRTEANRLRQTRELSERAIAKHLAREDGRSERHVRRLIKPEP